MPEHASLRDALHQLAKLKPWPTQVSVDTALFNRLCAGSTKPDYPGYPRSLVMLPVVVDDDIPPDTFRVTYSDGGSRDIGPQPYQHPGCDTCRRITEGRI